MVYLVAQDRHAVQFKPGQLGILILRPSEAVQATHSWPTAIRGADKQGPSFLRLERH